jgi:STE24 endopeptidase|tara:strand:+ start:449 stop:1585 length:1137 start_codon:yes stop_codon:yes gene_type:complete
VNEGKAARYHRLKRRTGLLASVGGGAVLLTLLASGGSAGIRNMVVQVVAELGLPPVWRHAGVVVAYTACVWAVLEGALLPVRFFQGFVLEQRYALLRIAAVRWVSTHLKRVALSGIVVAVAAVVVSLSLATWPAWWWVVSGAAFAMATIILTNLAPVCLIPLLYSVRPMTRARLTERLATLAERAGVSAPRVDECAVGATTRRAHATLVGLGPVCRILLSDTLLADYSDDEIEVVLAHELGHHVHRDVWQLMAFELSVALLALLVGGWTMVRLGGVFGVAGTGDVAGLPLLVLGAGGVVAAAAPFGYALSRRHERRADLFAIRMTRNPVAFISGLRRLGAQNLVEERPSRLVELLCHRHPPLYRRLAAARRAEAALQP